MRISDWSSDMCSSDLKRQRGNAQNGVRVGEGNSFGGGRHYMTAYGWRSMAGGFAAMLAVMPNAAAQTPTTRSEEHTSELQSLMRISYAVFCLKKKKNTTNQKTRY